MVPFFYFAHKPHETLICDNLFRDQFLIPNPHLTNSTPLLRPFPFLVRIQEPSRHSLNSPCPPLQRPLATTSQSSEVSESAFFFPPSSGTRTERKREGAEISFFVWHSTACGAISTDRPSFPSKTHITLPIHYHLSYNEVVPCAGRQHYAPSERDQHPRRGCLRQLLQRVGRCLHQEGCQHQVLLGGTRINADTQGRYAIQRILVGGSSGLTVTITFLCDVWTSLDHG